MMFQTVSDVLDYVLVIHAILGSYVFNIFDQTHIILMFTLWYLHRNNQSCSRCEN